MNNVITETRNRITKITINRPEKLNALNKATLMELNQVLVEFANNPEAGGAIITGAGPKAFVAGADISEFAQYSAEQGRELAAVGQTNVFDQISHCRKPIIAAINGFALGGGLELALACHLRVASTNAKLGLPEVSLGLIPGYGGTQRLTHLLGRAKSLELILTGEMITADEALQLGLLNYICPAEEVITKAESLLNKMLMHAPLALGAAITAVNSSISPKGFAVEIDEFGKLFATADFKEGASAFSEKRKAVFKGN